MGIYKFDSVNFHPKSFGDKHDVGFGVIARDHKVETYWVLLTFIFNVLKQGGNNAQSTLFMFFSGFSLKISKFK